LVRGRKKEEGERRKEDIIAVNEERGKGEGDGRRKEGGGRRRGGERKKEDILLTLFFLSDMIGLKGNPCHHRLYVYPTGVYHRGCNSVCGRVRKKKNGGIRRTPPLHVRQKKIN
jgi:hypothetical protein